MKDWVCKCLTTDGQAQEVAQELTWKGLLTGEHRPPDVRAVCQELPLAFEIQFKDTPERLRGQT